LMHRPSVSCVPGRPVRRPTLFPYTTLFRSIAPVRKKTALLGELAPISRQLTELALPDLLQLFGPIKAGLIQRLLHRLAGQAALLDRKSTRLNSSHVKISYAVFCLKKKMYEY